MDMTPVLVNQQMEIVNTLVMEDQDASISQVISQLRFVLRLDIETTLIGNIKVFYP